MGYLLQAPANKLNSSRCARFLEIEEDFTGRERKSLPPARCVPTCKLSEYF